MDLASAPAPARWFEFLLEPDKLKEHLETNNCDPSPPELIMSLFEPVDFNGKIFNTDQSNSSPTFPSIGPAVIGAQTPTLPLTTDPSEVLIPPDSYEAKYRSKKTYALQTLAVKVASYLNWDLNIISNNLTIPVQYKLMQALTRASSNENCPPEMKKFAGVLHARWFLRSAIDFQLSSIQPQSHNTTIIYLSQLQQQQQVADNNALYSMRELFAPKSKQLEACSSELRSYIWELIHNKDNSAKRLKSSVHPFKKAKLHRPKMDCFNIIDDQLNDWAQCDVIDSKEFMEAACYDLGRFYFFEESYELAKEIFEIISGASSKYTNLDQYIRSATELSDDKNYDSDNSLTDCDLTNRMNESRCQTEKYLFECMTQFSKSQKKENSIEIDPEFIEDSEEFERDSDLRLNQTNHKNITRVNGWYLQSSQLVQPLHLMEGAKGDAFMSQGNFKEAMGCFVGALMLMTDYFRFFSKNYIDEEPYISRMIQCSISLSCFTQAVALCQMTKSLNYTIAFKQLNERVCNDCCDDIYECIWNVTLLEYIINLHSKRGEVERRTKVIQLIGQLELNENNPEEILKEAEHVRRGKFFRIMSNKYM